MRCSLATTAVDRRDDYFAKKEVRQRPDFDNQYRAGSGLRDNLSPLWGKPYARRNTTEPSMKDRDLFAAFCQSFRDAFAAIPAPIAPDAQLREACECCADESLNVPKEACGVCRG
jgi:hypothetical protein